MPAIQKRSAKTAAKEFPEPKKARKEDPVQSKVASIITVLQDDAFEVPGTKSNREMLMVMAPSILGTPRDQRHAHMEAMVENIKELFANELARLQNKVTETEGQTAEASSELASRKGEVESAASALQVNVDELKGKQTTLAECVGVTRTAETTLKDTQFEFSILEETRSDLAQQYEVAQARMENFNMLKDGTHESSDPKEEHNLLKTLATFLRKIKADVSLVAALPMALGRKPAERSEFDAMAVIELEKKLAEKLSEIAAEIKSNEASIAEKTDFKATSETALVEAKEHQRAAAEAMLAIRAEQKNLSANLSAKKAAVVEQEFAVKALESELEEKLLFVKAHQDTQNTLTELIDRCTPVEAPADVVSEMPVVEVTLMEETVEADPQTVQDVAM